MKIEINVPEGKVNNWQVENFTVSEEEAQLHNLRCFINRTSGRRITPANYKRLVHNKTTVMSNTPAEIRDHLDFFRRAEGVILVHGLGLGLCIELMKKYNRITKMYIVEISRDVIELVWPTYKDIPNVHLIQADAHNWYPKKGFKFDAIWHDIWSFYNEDMYEDSKKLHRRFGRYVIGGNQDSWGRQAYFSSY